MGYYTYYSGEVINGPATEKDIALAIDEMCHFSDYPSTIEDIDDVIAGDAMKWYDYRENMEAISKKFPDTLIKIHGEGEDSSDLWDAYFLNGKSVVYHAEIYYPPLNLLDLQ